MSGTLGTGSEIGDRGVRVAPYLARILDADAPLAAPSWHSLDGVDSVIVGRSDEPVVLRRGEQLVLGIPDRRMSERHAELVRLGNRWELRDLGSKNGTRLEGASVTRGTVEAGDVLECGRSFFLLGGPAPVGAALDRAVEPAGLGSLDPELAAAFDELGRAATSDLAIVIAGETGTGKEVVARAVHARSGRSGAFVAINCGALPADLLEATLFGHVRGAFSGATTDQPGLLRAADHGTLLLDELADLSRAGQTALLRALQEREVVPVGATRPIAVDLRLVVATQRPLAALVAAGALRADLAHRLAGLTVELPPLRERRADLGLLIAALLARMPAAARPARIAPAAARALLAHDWPGNIRELLKLLELGAHRAAGDTLEVEHLALEPVEPAAPAPAPLPAADRARRDELIAALVAHRGNISAVARALARDRVQIRRWIARFELDVAAYR